MTDPDPDPDPDGETSVIRKRLEEPNLFQKLFYIMSASFAPFPNSFGGL